MMYLQLLNENELIIVWEMTSLKHCEYSELGVLGDLISSNDTKGTCSLLVEQQDQQEELL
jgi:hypothetical protein